MRSPQKETEQQVLHAARRQGPEEWLAQQPMIFTEHDDGVTLRLVDRITVVDVEITL